MRAILFFHGRAGIRLGLRAVAPLVGFAIAWTLFQDSPASFVDDVAAAAFAARVPGLAALPIVLAAFVLPAWARNRLSYGSAGWLRHLPVSSTASRRAMLIALAAVQIPLAALLVISAAVAVHRGASLLMPGIRWALVLAAGAVAALPVPRRRAVLAAAAIAAFLTISAWPLGLALAAVLLIATDAFAGPLMPPRRQPGVSRDFVPLTWRIGWRAIGLNAVTAYAAGGLALAAGWLFLRNNALSSVSASTVLRAAGGIACVVCLRSLSRALALRRSPWPFARSLPWSARQRVALDSLLLMAGALPLIVILSMVALIPALEVATLVPVLGCRAAGFVRRISDGSHGVRFVVEGALAAVMVAVEPLTAVAFLAAVPLALRASAEDERRLKITRWSEWQLADESTVSGRGGL